MIKSSSLQGSTSWTWSDFFRLFPSLSDFFQLNIKYLKWQFYKWVEFCSECLRVRPSPWSNSISSQCQLWVCKKMKIILISRHCSRNRAVGTIRQEGGGGGAIALQDFGRYFNPISIGGWGRLCPSYNYLPLAPDFQTFLRPWVIHNQFHCYTTPWHQSLSTFFSVFSENKCAEERRLDRKNPLLWCQYSSSTVECTSVQKLFLPLSSFLYLKNIGGHAHWYIGI